MTKHGTADLDGDPYRERLVGRQVVHDDDVARRERRGRHLFVRAGDRPGNNRLSRATRGPLSAFHGIVRGAGFDRYPRCAASPFACRSTRPFALVVRAKCPSRRLRPLASSIDPRTEPRLPFAQWQRRAALQVRSRGLEAAYVDSGDDGEGTSEGRLAPFSRRRRGGGTPRTDRRQAGATWPASSGRASIPASSRRRPARAKRN